MVRQTELLAMASDPGEFRARIYIETDCQRRFSEVIEPWQAADFAAMDPAWRRLVGQKVDVPHSRAWIERCRGGSKTQDLAISTLWALFASRRPLRGVVAAADRDQGRFLLDAIGRIVRLNDWLSQVITIQREKVLNPHTGSELQIITSDVASSWGLLIDFACCDETTVWRDRELFNSLLSSVAKKDHALMLCIQNAGWQAEWQWGFRQTIREDANWYFSHQDRPASWISADRLAEQQRLLPDLVFRRCWLNEWSSGTGDAITTADIDAAIDVELPQHPVDGEQYVAGLDIGLAHDATGLAVVGKDSQGRLTVRAVRRWRAPKGGKLDLSSVETEIFELHQEFRFRKVALDPWQGSHLCQRLKRAGVPIEERSQSGNKLTEQAMATIEAFRDRRLALPNHPELLAELRRARVVEKSYGFRLEFPRDGSGHGDVATSLSIALAEAKSLKGGRGGYVIPNPDAPEFREKEIAMRGKMFDADVRVSDLVGYVYRVGTLGKYK
jgi:phage terminase large subunit-like protein